MEAPARREHRERKHGVDDRKFCAITGPYPAYVCAFQAGEGKEDDISRTSQDVGIPKMRIAKSDMPKIASVMSARRVLCYGLSPWNDAKAIYGIDDGYLVDCRSLAPFK